MWIIQWLHRGCQPTHTHGRGYGYCSRIMRVAQTWVLQVNTPTAASIVGWFWLGLGPAFWFIKQNLSDSSLVWFGFMLVLNIMFVYYIPILSRSTWFCQVNNLIFAASLDIGKYTNNLRTKWVFGSYVYIYTHSIYIEIRHSISLYHLFIAAIQLNIIWLVVWNMAFIFPYIGNNHPNWLIFFRGIETTNQSCSWLGYTTIMVFDISAVRDGVRNVGATTVPAASESLCRSIIFVCGQNHRLYQWPAESISPQNMALYGTVPPL